jgi:hypothetical protein
MGTNIKGKIKAKLINDNKNQDIIKEKLPQL